MNGQYVYQYNDFTGNRHCINSIRLEKTDSYPDRSRKRELSLHEKEKAIKDKIECGTCVFGINNTVFELAERYIDTQNGVKESTGTGYRKLLETIERCYFVMSFEKRKLFLHSLFIFPKLNKGFLSVSIFP